MVNWRTSRFVILFLTLMTFVVGALAVVEVRSNRRFQTSVVSDFSLSRVFDNFSNPFSGSSDVVVQNDSVEPRVAGTMVEAVGPRFPINLGKRDVANPFIPTP